MSIRINQISDYVEIITENDVQKTVHYVIKNVHFKLHIGIVNADDMSFFDTDLQCQLLYDVEGEERTVSDFFVEFISRPLTCGRKSEIDIRLKVLSTHSLFKVRFRLFRDDESFIEGFTDSIKSVYRSEQIRRKIDTDLFESRRKKRTRDEMPDYLKTIQDTQNKHGVVLYNIIDRLENKSINQNSPMYCNNVRPHIQENTYYSYATNDSYLTSASPEENVYEAFSKLLDCYEKMELNERPKKMRKIVSDLSKVRPDVIANFEKDLIVLPHTFLLSPNI
jgi:hypothetical protein